MSDNRVIPTDQMLNEAMAIVCGRERCITVVDGPLGNDFDVVTWCLHGDETDCTLEDPYDPVYGLSTCWLPEYCTNRNALAEVWSVVKKADKDYEFMHEVFHIADGEWPSSEFDAVWLAKTVPPRIDVIAALKVLGKWPAEWKLEDEEEED